MLWRVYLEMESITISFRQLIKVTICESELTTEKTIDWLGRIRNRAGDNEYVGQIMEKMFNECIRFLIEKKQTTKINSGRNRLMLVAYRLDRNSNGVFKVVYFPVNAIQQKSLKSLW